MTCQESSGNCTLDHKIQAQPSVMISFAMVVPLVGCLNLRLVVVGTIDTLATRRQGTHPPLFGFFSRGQGGADVRRLPPCLVVRRRRRRQLRLHQEGLQVTFPNAPQAPSLAA